MKSLIALLICINANHIFAKPIRGGQITHGSDVVECKNGNKKTYQILDIHEAMLRNENFDSLKKYDRHEIIKKIQDRLSAYGYSYEEFSKRLFTLQMFMEYHRGRLDNIEDESDYLIAENCKLHQLSVNYFRFDLVLIDTMYWTKLDEINKAAFFVHETLYSIDKKYNYSNSKNTRALVASMFADLAYDERQKRKGLDDL